MGSTSVRVAAINSFAENVDAFGDRTSTDIIAPGYDLDVAGPDGSLATGADRFGSSYAAPHVTGTLALLHQDAASQHSAARQPEVMKAIILNSADKIEGIIGMERTVVTTNGEDDWFDTFAHVDSATPLDREMGAGHLNANRAVQQLRGGKHNPGSVPAIGWNWAEHNDPFTPDPYTLPDLSEGDYVSATLAWNRVLALNTSSENNQYEPGDTFTGFDLFDLNLYLVRTGEGPSQAIASSISTVDNVEHIFARIPSNGSYQILVELNEDLAPEFGFYGLAWWAGPDMSKPPGDHNGDGSVDGADYVAWRKNPSAFGGDPGGYDEWRMNFGSTSGSGGTASVPEPGGIVVAVMMMAGVLCRRCSARRRASSCASY
jgi:hypothetical protein